MRRQLVNRRNRSEFREAPMPPPLLPPLLSASEKQKTAWRTLAKGRVYANSLRKRLANPTRPGKAIAVQIMPKKAKVNDNEKARSDGAALNGNTAKPAAKKARSPRKKATTPKTGATQKEKSPISDEAIRIRAYFISEQRERLAIPGDANSDWIEARRQLLAELGES